MRYLLAMMFRNTRRERVRFSASENEEADPVLLQYDGLRCEEALRRWDAELWCETLV